MGRTHLGGKNEESKKSRVKFIGQGKTELNEKDTHALLSSYEKVACNWGLKEGESRDELGETPSSPAGRNYKWHKRVSGKY